MKHILKILAGAFVVGLAGCSLVEHRSAIVQRAEAAGAGDLRKVSTLSMQSWLERHRDLAQDLDHACAAVRAKATAEWGDTTEGRLCQAARSVAMTTFRPLEGDHKRYGAAWK